MNQSATDLAQILIQAMQLERDGHAFYLAAAEQTRSDAGRRMFLSLARDELHHLNILDGVYRSWVGEGTWPASAELGLEAPRRLPIFPPAAKAADFVEPQASELVALQQGIAAEESSISLYRQGMESATAPQAEQFYSYLVEQEEGHRTILQGEYDHLTHTGFWFDFPEFSMEARE